MSSESVIIAKCVGCGATKEIHEGEYGSGELPMCDKCFSPMFAHEARTVVSEDDECWDWQAATLQGYGLYGRAEDKEGPYRTRFAHRIAYELLVGPIPDGLVIDHLCRNRACCNPGHLEPVTNKENLLRGESFSAKSARKTHCKRGHPFSGDNLRIAASGARQCRACAAIKSREGWLKKKAARAAAKSEAGR